MDRKDIKDKLIVNITIEKIVMNFERVGLVVNANGNVVVDEGRGLIAKYVEDAVQVIRTRYQRDL